MCRIKYLYIINITINYQKKTTNIRLFLLTLIIIYYLLSYYITNSYKKINVKNNIIHLSYFLLYVVSTTTV